MGRSVLRLFLLLIVVGQEGNTSLLTGVGQDNHTVRASSQPRVLETEATAEASEELYAKLVDYLSARTAADMPKHQLRHHLPRLLADPRVRWETRTETTEKAYGPVHQRHLAVSLPDQAIHDWVAEIVTEGNARTRFRAVAVVLTVLGWLMGVGMIVKLDRWTRGYHRPAIVASTVLLLLFGSGALWIVVLLTL